jgi:hypothetical protein
VCLVPALIGRSLAAASTLLSAAKCTVGTIKRENSSTIAAGLVISSSPKAGTSHAVGEKVKLNVSLGPKAKKVKVKLKGRVIKIKTPKPPKIIIHWPKNPDDGDGYIDPSGQVLTTTGIPIANAVVTLLRSAVSAGPFTAVPNGSLEMSPSNRVNPGRTSSLGVFGWDVVPGFYEVTAQHPACTAPGGGSVAQTTAAQVPPPVTNLLLTLRCPKLKRSKSSISLRFKAITSGSVIVTATVHGKRPSGFVQFSAGGVGAAVALSSAHTASFVVAPGVKLSARYEGDGVNKPSSVRAHE